MAVGFRDFLVGNRAISVVFLFLQRGEMLFCFVIRGKNIACLLHYGFDILETGLGQIQIVAGNIEGLLDRLIMSANDIVGQKDLQISHDLTMVKIEVSGNSIGIHRKAIRFMAI